MAHPSFNASLKMAAAFLVAPVAIATGVTQPAEAALFRFSQNFGVGEITGTIQLSEMVRDGENVRQNRDIASFQGSWSGGGGLDPFSFSFADANQIQLFFSGGELSLNVDSDLNDRDILIETSSGERWSSRDVAGPGGNNPFRVSFGFVDPDTTNNGNEIFAVSAIEFERVPEPLTLGGSFLAIAFGAAMKKVADSRKA